MAQRPNIYDLDLDKNTANHAPLTPLTFLAWTARCIRSASPSCTAAGA
jgi:hypothetical protein